MVEGMRSAPETGEHYADMLETFGSAVCRKSVWKKKQSRSLSEMMTPELEAFLIILLENMVPVEVENYQIQEMKKDAERASYTRRGAASTQDLLIPEPKEIHKYAVGSGGRYCTKSKQTCNGYFNEDAMDRYKVLLNLINVDRNTKEGRQVEEDHKQKAFRAQKLATPQVRIKMAKAFDDEWLHLLENRMAGGSAGGGPPPSTDLTMGGIPPPPPGMRPPSLPVMGDPNTFII